MTLSVTNQYIDRGVFCAAEIMYILKSQCIVRSLTRSFARPVITNVLLYLYSVWD